MVSKYLISGVFLGGILAMPLHAQDDQEDVARAIVIADYRQETVIVVSGLGDGTLNLGRSVGRIARDEIEEVQGEDITRLLERLPGVTLTRNGGLGSFTGVNVRGAESHDLVVVIDGVRMADAAAPGGGFDFGNLLASGIEGFDLLRGSNSLAWGADAVGGVLSLTTRSVNGAEGSIEGGSLGTLGGNVVIGRTEWPIDASLGGGYFTSNGISSAASGSEPDGFEQWHLAGRANAEMDRNIVIRASARYAGSRLDLDGFPAPDYQLADTAEWQETGEFGARLGLGYNDYPLEMTADLSFHEIRRDLFDPAFGAAPGFATLGQERRAELRGRWSSGDWEASFGGSYAASRFASNFGDDARDSIGGTYLRIGTNIDGFRIGGGLRWDHHDRFGGHWVAGADASLPLWDDVRLIASYGEGFSAPTLFQLHSDYGNTVLRPEASQSFELGLVKDTFVPDVRATLVVFRRDSRDLIDFISCFGMSEGICENRPFGTYDNIGRSRAQGIEAQIMVKAGEHLHLQGAWSYIEAENRTPGAGNEGNRLARRPRHALTLSANWETPLAGLIFGSDLRVVSSSFDDAANLVSLDGYALGTIRASFPVSEQVEIFGRVENIWDERYQTAAGYGTHGRSAYIGVRLRR